MHGRPQLKDFRNVLSIGWKFLNLPRPTDVQYDIAYFLQHGHNNRMVQAFRGVGKTYITALYVMWRLSLDPDLKIAIVSQSADFAKKISNLCYQFMNMEIFHFLQPRKNQRSSTVEFDVGPSTAAKDPSLYSVGITSQITGMRADIVLSDDVETPNNSMTPTQREQLRERVREYSRILKPGGEIIYLGTPQTEDSLYNYLEGMKYEIKIWPIEVPVKKDYYVGRVTPYIQNLFDTEPPGTPCDPMRFNEETITLKRIEESEASYQLQYMLNPLRSDQDKNPLKLKDFIVLDVDPEVAPEKIVWAADRSLEYDPADVPMVGFSMDRYYKPWQVLGDWLPYRASVMSIDPSGRGKDETSYAVVKEHNGYFYLIESGGFTGGYESSVLEGLALIAKKNKINEIIIESNFGDGAWTELFKPVLNKVHPCTVEEVRSSKQKELRIIDILEPILSQHRFVIDKKVIDKDYHECTGRYSKHPNQYMLMYQISRITRDKGCLLHDDRIDALALAIGHLKDFMATDVDQEMLLRDQAYWDEIREKSETEHNKPKDPRDAWNWKGNF